MSLKHHLRKPYSFRTVALTVILGFAFSIHAQIVSDSIQFDTVSEVTNKKSIFSGRPGKSLLFSLVVPGTGQIYNKSYLRVPFVWGAVGGMGYLLHFTSKRYQIAKEAYIAKVDNLPYPHVNDDYGEFFASQINSATTAADIRPLRDRTNKYRQQAIVGFSLVWLAQSIDAFVDAHLKTFDVTNDLSLDFSPRVDNDPNAPMRVGLFLTLK